MSLPNKFGLCPHCNYDWDGGDIYEQLCQMDVYAMKTPEFMMELAGNTYGWEPTDKRRFTNVVTHQLAFGITNTDDRPSFMECPMCRHAWDLKTGIEYGSVHNATYQIDPILTRAEQIMKDIIISKVEGTTLTLLEDEEKPWDD
jgi:hypothetical protein